MDVPFPARFTLWLKRSFSGSNRWGLYCGPGAPSRLTVGGSDRAALETAMQHLQAGQLLGIFIEGGRNRTGGENMLPPQPGAAMLAVKAGVPIIPVALIGTDAIGYRPFRRVAAVIGGPIRPQEGGKSHKELYQELGVEITRVIGELKKSLPER